jgi:hypothetical protein
MAVPVVVIRALLPQTIAPRRLTRAFPAPSIAECRIRVCA